MMLVEPSPRAGLDRLLGSRARARILESFLRAPERAWRVRRLAEAAGVDYKSAWTQVAEFRRLGLIAPHGTGRTHAFVWNRSHPAAAYLEGLVKELGEEGPLRIVRDHLS